MPSIWYSGTGRLRPFRSCSPRLDAVTRGPLRIDRTPARRRSSRRRPHTLSPCRTAPRKTARPPLVAAETSRGARRNAGPSRHFAGAGLPSPVAGVSWSDSHPSGAQNRRRRRNWLPAPADGLILMMRLYWPKKTPPSDPRQNVEGCACREGFVRKRARDDESPHSHAEAEVPRATDCAPAPRAVIRSRSPGGSATDDPRLRERRLPVGEDLGLDPDPAVAPPEGIDVGPQGIRAPIAGDEMRRADHVRVLLQESEVRLEPPVPDVGGRDRPCGRIAGDQAARTIYQPVAIDDPGFPNSIYTLIALASGTQQAGEVLFPRPRSPPPDMPPVRRPGTPIARRNRQRTSDSGH